MSNRFHSKFHRQNHHTYTSATNPDAGHDPIASREQPFWGDFVLAGALSCVAPPSAVAGYFNSNHTALCAIAGERGEYIYSFGKLGLEVYSAQSTAISAVGPYMGANISSSVYGINVYGGQYGINTYSPFYGINSYGGTYGGNYYSPIRALSAYGGQYALDAYSPFYGTNVYGGVYGGRFYSPIRALSAYGGFIGLDLYSPVSGIYAYGGSAGGIFKSPIRALSANGGIVGFEVYSPVSAINAFGGIVGARVYSPIRAISAYGGNIGIDVYSPNLAISAVGLNTGINVYSQNVAINSNSDSIGMSLNGGAIGAVISSPVVALSTGGFGINRFDNRVGIFRTPQQNYNTSPNIVLDVNGNSYFDGDLTVTGDLSALGRLTYLDTIVQTTSSLIVTNHSASAAGTFTQYSNQPILVCYDGDISTTISSFIIDGASNGWVALGTNTPSAPLNIVKNNTSTQANNQPQIRISDDNTTTKLALGTPRTNRPNTSIGTETNHSFDIITNNNTRLTVLNSGNVGIGTTTPNSTLTVFGDISASSNVSTQILSAYDIKLIHPVPNDGINPNFFIGEVGDGSAGTITGFTSGFNIKYDEIQNKFSISTNFGNQTALSALIIDSSANVGIGTSSPNTTLTVNGAISSNNNLTVNGQINAGNNLTVNGTISANGSITSINGVTVQDRISGNNYSTFYRASDKTKLYDSVAGDILYYDTSGQVGIGGLPTTGKKLSVTGDVFFSGEINGTLSNSSNYNNSANTTIATPGQGVFNTTVSMQANSNYELSYNVLYTTSAGGQATFALSTNNTVNASGFITHTNNSGIPVNANNGSFNGTGITSTSLLSLPKPISSNASTLQGATITFYVQTGANATTANLVMWGSIAGTITVKQGSYWKKTNLN